MADPTIPAESTAPGGLEATRVTADEVITRLGRGEPLVFVDARNEDEWEKSDEKLPGALRLSPEVRDEEETLPLIPRDRGVITYCTCPHEESAARVADFLIARGLTDVHPLYGGMEAWRRAGGTFSPK
jgi:rhodanese-related sulfurtransferase